MPDKNKTYYHIHDFMQNRAWALHPEKLKEINAAVERVLIDQEPVPESFTAATKKSRESAENERYTVRDGVAIIPAYGTMSKRINMFMEISGGTSTEMLQEAITQAADDRSVDAIVLDIDSPGGSVDGTKEAADLVYSIRVKKPVVAFANGLMASAAYWIGSAAHRIVAPETAEIGSIGVAMTHYDYSARDKASGVKKTHIYAGKYKRMATPDQPLSKEAKSYLQEIIDDLYTLFVDAVARNRGADTEYVLEHMADGKIFIGNKALEAGLIDMHGSINAAVQLARDLADGVEDVNKTVLTVKEDTTMADITVAQLKEKHPAIYDEVFAAGAASVDVAQAAEEARQEGAAAERERCAGIMAIEGDQDVKKKAIDDGTSLEASYRLFFEAEKAKKTSGATEIEAKAPASVGTAAAREPTNPDDQPADFMAAVDQAIADGKAQSKKDAMDVVMREQPELHEVWLKDQGAR